MSFIRSTFLFFIFWITPFLNQAQSGIDHWETAVYNSDIWSYRLGFSPPPFNWNKPDFNDSNWPKGPGGFGYGDGDDNTIIPTTLSVYIRIEFEITDLTKINMAVLHADYDDAFVAYFNGTEIARGNFGASGNIPAHYEMPTIDHEATLHQGGLPEAYLITPQTLEQLAKEGKNTLAIQVHNFLISSSDLSSNFFLSFGINDDSRDYGPTPSWFFEPVLGTSLPLIRINTQNQQIVDDPRIIAAMQIVDNGPEVTNFWDDPATDYDGRISIEIRGASSQFFDKKNYGFETQDENGDNNNVSLLGMPEENDWILHGPYSDKSLIRNALTFQMGRDIMDYASRTRFCELMINGDYRGIYLLMEKIKRDDNRVDISNLRPEDVEGDELTGGYIFQIDRDDETTTEDGWKSPYGNLPFYAFHHPNKNQLLPVQKQYIQDWMTEFEFFMAQPFFASRYQDYIDVSSFIDYFLINEVTKHIDAFKLSFFMYKRKDSNGGKLHFGPIWDFNLGYGNFDFGCPPDPEGWIYPCTSRAFWLNKMMNIGAIRNRMGCRWKQLREDKLNTEYLINSIDAMVEEMGPAIDLNFERFDIMGTYVWPNDFIGNSHEEEIDFLKDWLIQRLEWMDANMYGNTNVDCDILLNAGDEGEIEGFKVYPNPFSNQLTFESELFGNKKGKILIYDNLGKLIARFQLQKNQSINLQQIPSGFYFFEYRIDNQLIKQGKLIKQ